MRGWGYIGLTLIASRVGHLCSIVIQAVTALQYAGIITELLDVTNGDQIREVVQKHQDINVVFNCAGCVQERVHLQEAKMPLIHVFLSSPNV